MGYISSTCKKLTPITDTNGNGSATPTFTFNDPSGSAFTMSMSGNGYKGLRTNAKYKYFRMSYEWYGNGTYLGPFWGNASSTEIWQGNATGYKTAQLPESGGSFNVTLRDTNSNTSRKTGPNTGFSANDSNWHTTVVEVMPYCVRQSIDGNEVLTVLFQDSRSIVSTVGDEITKEGYCGLLWYQNEYQIRNFSVEPIELPKNWEHFATYSSSTTSSIIDMIGILDRNEAGYSQVKVVIDNLIPSTNNAELYLRISNGSGTAQTTSAYYGNLHTISHNSQHTSRNTSAGDAGCLFDDMWGNDGGGVHGEILISNYGLTPWAVLDNSITKGAGSSTNKFRPILDSTLTGYDSTSGDNSATGYTRQDSFIRYNVDASASAYGGIVLFPSSGSFEKDYIINVYGLRSSVA